VSPYTSTNSKWIKDLNLRPEILKPGLERAGYTLILIGLGNDFLKRTQMAQQLRESIDKWDYMKLKIFCTTKEMFTRLKRKPTEWEKIFASYTFWLITRIYRELKILNSQRINDPMKE
jgi:hypothetical protein